MSLRRNPPSLRRPITAVTVAVNGMNERWARGPRRDVGGRRKHPARHGGSPCKSNARSEAPKKASFLSLAPVALDATRRHESRERVAFAGKEPSEEEQDRWSTRCTTVSVDCNADLMTEEVFMAQQGTSNRGFASMDRARQREIASLGGKAAHAKGTAHEFTPEEAREAGRKGGQASGERRAEAARLREARRIAQVAGRSERKTEHAKAS